MNQLLSEYRDYPRAYHSVYEEYVHNAAFLWNSRSIAVTQPHHTRDSILQLDNRLNTRLGTLTNSFEQAWNACIQAFQWKVPGEVFTTAILAFESLDTDKVRHAVNQSFTNEDTFNALASSLGWLPENIAQPWIRKLLTSKTLDHKHLAIAACSFRRKDPRSYLNKLLRCEDCQAHTSLYAGCLRLIGEIHRQDLMSELQQASQHENTAVRFWANYSAILLGNRAAVQNLQPFVFEQSACQKQAIDLVFRVLPIRQSYEWIAQLAEDDSMKREVIRATAALGDPHAVRWLLLQMQEPDLARVAGEAFSLITGIDLERQGLAVVPPESFHANSAENHKNDDVEMKEDQYLPWPAVDQLKRLWQQQSRHFTVGQRHFMGKPPTRASLLDNIQNAKQRQRWAAALSLALLDPGQPLQNMAAASTSGIQ